VDSVKTRCAEKPQTVLFYESKMARLLEFTPMADTGLDRIDEGMIESFVQHRRKTVSAASVNRELATPRRALRLAHEWKVINRVLRIRLLPGERSREFVLSHAQERLYLDMAPQPLRDVAVLILDTGLRVGETLALEWRDVHLEPVNGARLGYIHVRNNKTKNAQRNVSITSRARAILEARQKATLSPLVFCDDRGRQIPADHLDHAHARLRALLRLPAGAVIHSLRHTMLTRLGESGVDTFTIMRIAGHSTVTLSQRYVHPSSEASGRAFERLEAANQEAVASLPEGPRRQLLATVSATVKGALEGRTEQVL
jgi:site-specific recombinase XerD